MITFTCQTKNGIWYRRAFAVQTIQSVVENPETKEVFLLLGWKGLFKRKREWVLVEGSFDEVTALLTRKILVE